MRVCLIGDFAGNPNEGMKNVARYLSQKLEENDVEIFQLDVNEVFSPKFYKEIIEFDPDVIHYIPGIGWRNIILVSVLKRLTEAETAISAIHPDVTALPKPLVRLLGPSLVFTQNENLCQSLSDCGVQLASLPNGVDTVRFRPLSKNKRREVRDQFDLPKEGFLALHVGHLTDRRNLHPLLELQRSGVQVVIVASDHFESQSEITKQLRNSECIIIDQYVEEIELLYGATDCYVFPTQQGETIQMPLSVLEAMACDLPVVSVKHPGFPQSFESASGFQFVNSAARIVDRVLEIKASEIEVNTREKAKEFSWDQIADQAEEEYMRITHS